MEDGSEGRWPKLWCSWAKLAEREVGPMFGGCDMIHSEWETRRVPIKQAFARVDPIVDADWVFAFRVRCLQELAATGSTWGHHVRVWRWAVTFPVEQKDFPKLAWAVQML